MSKSKIVTLENGDSALVIRRNVDGMGSYDVELTYNFDENVMPHDEILFFTLLLRGMVYYATHDTDVLIASGTKSITNDYNNKVTIH